MIALTGADPERHTIGQLRRMAEAIDAQEWHRTSCVLATMINLNSSKKVQPWQLNPYTAPRKMQRTIKDLAIMWRGSKKVREIKQHAATR